MIQFPCRCKHIFQFPDDMAGKQVQCPDCQRLVDVPTFDELSELSDDGTFRLDVAIEPDPHQFEKMHRAFAREKVDENGMEIDLRQTREEQAAAGTEDDINAFENRPTAPKYDPETGELVRPLDIVDDPTLVTHPSQIPIASTTLNYARADMNPSYSLTAPFIQLFNPINIAAMFFVLLAHIFFYMSIFSLFLSVAAIFVTGPGIIAHYANVIEEVGIEERDELPRFLRHFSLADDVWYPFAHVFLAWMICFGPAHIMELIWIAHHWPVAGEIVGVIALDIAGLIFFPAIVLTTTTSGSLLNLRPDRILGVISTIGPRYAFLVILYAVAITVYFLGLIATPVQAFFLLNQVKSPPFIFTGIGAYGTIIIGIILMHYFAWLLGLTYRTSHLKFGWIYHQQERLIPGINAPRYFRPPTAGFPNQPPVRHHSEQ